MIIDKLRQSTSEIHKELDLWLMPVFKNVNDTTEYATLLKAFYGYYAPVMELITVEIDTHYLPDFTQRRTPLSILDDLNSIDQTQEEIKFTELLPSVKSASEAFGALYVLEGSTLGGVFLSKMLAANMTIDENKGLSFFYGYGQESKSMWSVFVEAINCFANEKGDEALILSSANDTFRYLKIHLQQCLEPSSILIT